MKTITPVELKGLIAGNIDIFLIDVREEWEHEHYNIGGLLLPMGELISRKSEIPKDKEVIFYCEKGIRSVIAIQRLEAMGYDNLVNLEGGMTKWKMIN